MSGTGCSICMRGAPASRRPGCTRRMQPSLRCCFKASFCAQNSRLKTLQRSETLTPRWDYRSKQTALCVSVLSLYTAVIVWYNHKDVKHQNTSWSVDLYPACKYSLVILNQNVENASWNLGCLDVMVSYFRPPHAYLKFQAICLPEI